MSVRIMTAVWESDLPADQKFLLLALADWADDMGGSIYPAVATMASKCSLSVSTVQRRLAALREDGILVAEGHREWGAGGRYAEGTTVGRSQTVLYRIALDRLGKGRNLTPFPEKGRSDDGKGSQPEAERVADTTAKGSNVDRQSVRDPSGNHPGTVTAPGAGNADLFGASGSVAPKRRRGTVAPIDPELPFAGTYVEIADRHGLTGPAALDEWDRFKAWHEARRTLYLWPGAWRTWVLRWKADRQHGGTETIPSGPDRPLRSLL